MRRIDRLLAEYGESHQHETNKLIHWVCVPLIVFSIVGLLWSLPHATLAGLFPEPVAPFVNWATLALAAVMLYYVTLSVPLAMGMLVLIGLFSFCAECISEFSTVPLWSVSGSIFLLAWVGQFTGHKLEKKKPSFFKDIQFLLIGPAWLIHFVYNRIGWRY